MKFLERNSTVAGHTNGDRAVGPRACGSDATEPVIPDVLLRSSMEVMVVLSCLHSCRAVLDSSHSEIRRCDDTAVCYRAASQMLDTVERAHLLLDEIIGVVRRRHNDAAYVRVRDELNNVASCLQFGAITDQQLKRAARELEQIERRLVVIGELFGAPAPTFDHHRQSR